MAKKRVYWVDVMKYICIMCVVITHLESYTSLVYNFYAPFFLNGFFFASGYVYKHNDDFGSFICGKLRYILWPWFLLSMFNIATRHILSFNSQQSIFEDLKWCFLQIRTCSDELWFFPALFVAFIPFYFVIKAYEKSNRTKKATVLLLLISSLLYILNLLYYYRMDPGFFPWNNVNLPWHIENICIAVFWMVMGYLFKHKFEEHFDSHCSMGMGLGLFVLYIVTAYIPKMQGLAFSDDILNIIWEIEYALVAVFLLIFVSKKIQPNKYILYIGQNTLLVFALHGKVLSILQAIITKLFYAEYSTILSNIFLSAIFSIVLAIIISLILIIPIYIINNWLPWVVGKKKKQ